MATRQRNKRKNGKASTPRRKARGRTVKEKPKSEEACETVNQKPIS